MKALAVMRALITLNCFVTASLRATVPPVVTTEYLTDFRNPVYVNIGAVDQVPFTVSGVTFVTDPAHVAGQFVGFPATGGSGDPGDGTGYLSANAGSPTPIPFITITFNQPLAAFGVTFYHRNFDLHMELPSTLSVFDGPNGSGNLLGQVTSFRPNDDFVGIWSSARNIQSAILRGTGEQEAFAVDAYGFSFTPVPEPAPMILIGLVISCWLVRRAYCRFLSTKKIAGAL